SVTPAPRRPGTASSPPRLPPVMGTGTTERSPRGDHSAATAHDSEDKDHAQAAANSFAADDGTMWPKAAAKITDDLAQRGRSGAVYPWRTRLRRDRRQRRTVVVPAGHAEGAA